MSLSTTGAKFEIYIHTVLNENGYTGKMDYSRHTNLYLAPDLIVLFSIVVIIAELVILWHLSPWLNRTEPQCWVLGRQ